MHLWCKFNFKEVEVMTKYREILRLTALGFSQRDICSSAGVSQKTVSKVQKRARELQLAWPLDESITDIALRKKLFPHEAVQTERRMPDFEYVRKELQRNQCFWDVLSTFGLYLQPAYSPFLFCASFSAR